MEAFTVFFFFSTILPILINSVAVDTITANHSIRDGDTIVSAAGNFELGFFSPGTSKNRYLGIWYKKISSGTVVWVANRAIPLTDTSGVLKVDSAGILVLLNSTNDIIWSANTSRSGRNPVAQLLDTGNLVMRDESDSNPQNFLWQSFDYPGDTLLPGAKLGKDLVTGQERYMSSWKSTDNPSPGEYTYGVDPSGYPQKIQRKGSLIQFESGPWNGHGFSGIPHLKSNPIYSYDFVTNQKEVYYQYELINSSVASRLVLNLSGIIQRFVWNDQYDWILYLTTQMDNCDRYGLCGPYGSCNINNSPPCECLKGFEPKSREEWYAAVWSNGCVRITQLECGSGEGFLMYSGVKLPNTQHSAGFNDSKKLEECEKVCLRNCNCTAYTNLDVRGGGSGCLFWFTDLIDIRKHEENAQDIYVRMAASELGKSSGTSAKRRVKIIVIPILVTGVIFLSLFWFLHVLKKRNKLNREENNKLGEGGFGSVYKGKLEEGQEIAMKRLSKNSRQGLDEFKNEVLCIARLQH